MPKGISLHIGLNRVDPDHYRYDDGGWDGKLSGCEADADAMATIAAQQGFTVLDKLSSEKATRDAVIRRTQEAAAETEAGDLFLMTFAGHGGAVAATSGDQDDWQAETLCLYDGQILDEELYELWAAFKEGVRILVVADSCHTGPTTQEIAQGEAAEDPAFRFMPVEVETPTYRTNQEFYDGIRKQLPHQPTPIGASVLALSACQDGARDGSDHGLFTSRLLQTWTSDSPAFEGDYRAFRDAIGQRMPADQQPSLDVVGDDPEAFESQQPFTVLPAPIPIPAAEEPRPAADIVQAGIPSPPGEHETQSPDQAPGETGSIEVVVRSSWDGEALPGALVKITAEATDVERRLSTDAKGLARERDLPAGIYFVEAGLDGFRAAPPQEVLLRPGRPVPLRFALQLEDIAEEIIVSHTAWGQLEERPLRRGLALSGGAPNATCMAGAMKYIHEQDMNFEVVTTSGAGALVALLYYVPRGGDTRQALEASVKMGIEDLIYRYLPINYKVFKQRGELAAAYRHLTQPAVNRAHGLIDRWFEATSDLREACEPWLAHQRRAIKSLAGIKRLDDRQLTHDWLDLVHSLMSPVQLGPSSLGCCAHPPFVSSLVDFDAIKSLPMEFYLNSYNVTRGETEVFGKEEITERHFDASLAYPFFYEPYKMPNGEIYLEGAVVDAINYQALEKSKTKVTKILVFDVVGDRGLIHKPRNLIDAFAQSIIVPLIELARNDTQLVENELRRKRYRARLTWLKEQACEHAASILDQLDGILEGLEGAPDRRELDRLVTRLVELKAEVYQRDRQATDVDIEKEYEPTILSMPFLPMNRELRETSLDWSASNLAQQFEFGYESAKAYFEDPENSKIKEMFKQPLWEGQEELATP